MGSWSDYRVFYREFRENFETTGAILPSGRSLAKALTRYVPEPGPPRRILEVGPGTGAVTTELVRRLRGSDEFNLVELNDRFVERLRERFATEPDFLQVADRCRVLHHSVEDIPDDDRYDLIVSGLPLNNFPVTLVVSILRKFRSLLLPGGTLSFFEYIAIRKIKGGISPRGERERLRGVSSALDGLLAAHEVRRDWVWMNVLPAWVHHVQIA
jgi:phospholipid N-methyltransferase